MQTKRKEPAKRYEIQVMVGHKYYRLVWRYGIDEDDVEVLMHSPQYWSDNNSRRQARILCKANKHYKYTEVYDRPLKIESKDEALGLDWLEDEPKVKKVEVK